MVFADFQTWLGQQMVILMLFLALGTMVIKAFLKDNEQIKDAAKNAVTRKTVDMIGKFFGRK